MSVLCSDETMIELNRIIVARVLTSATIDFLAGKSMSLVVFLWVNKARSKNNMADGEVIHGYPGKTRSTVWRFFGFKKSQEGPPVKSNLDMNVVICRLCLKSYANKGKLSNKLHNFG